MVDPATNTSIDLVTIASVVSSLAAVAGLIYAAIQIKRNSEITRLNTITTRQTMYVAWLEIYLHLKELVLTHPELDDIYKNNIQPTKLLAKQKHYIYSVIAFCEVLYQTDQIDSFPSEIPGASWKNYIIHQMGSPTIKTLWDLETNKSKSSDFTDEFISWVNNNFQ